VKYLKILFQLIGETQRVVDLDQPRKYKKQAHQYPANP